MQRTSFPKRLSLFLSVCLVIALFLPALSNAGAEVGKVEIYVWHYHTAAAGENLEAIINEYNALPNAKAKVIAQTLPRDDLRTRLTLGVISGDLPELAIVDNPDNASFAAMGLFMDITDKVSTLPNPTFLEGPFKSGQLDGKQYALPIRSNCLALWVNDAMFEKVGIEKMPVTWEDLLAICEKLKASQPDVYPIAFSAPKNEQATFQFIPFLYGAGGTWEDMGSEQAIKALELYKTFADMGYSSEDVINWSQNDVQKQFASNNAAMMIAGSWNIANMAKDAPDLSYSIINIPKESEFATCLGGENMGLTVKAEEKLEAVWDFYSWFMSLETSVKYNRSDRTFSPNAEATQEMMYPDDLVMASFMEQLTYGIARGPHPKWAEVSSAVQEAIQNTLTGLKTPEAAGADAAEVISRIK